MSNRSVVILLIVALSMAGMVLLFERQVSQEVAPSADEYKVFKAYAQDEVRWVSLSAGELAVQLEREAEGWQMISPIQATADAQRVDDLLGVLEGLMEVAVPIKAGPGEQINFQDYGLIEPRGRIIVRYGGAEAVLSLGNRTQKGNQLYARLGKENRVMIIGAEAAKLLEEVKADENLYRSRRVFEDKHINKVLSMQFVSSHIRADKPITLAKDERSQQWMLRWPIEDRADPEVVQEVLNRCAFLRVGEFIKLPADRVARVEMLKAYGLNGPVYSGVIAIEAEGVQSVQLYIGRLNKQTNQRWALVDERSMLARRQELVTIPADFVDVLPKSIRSLRDKKFLRVENSAVSEIRLSSPEGVVVLRRAKSEQDGASWVIASSEGAEDRAADQGIVEDLLADLGDLTATGLGGAVQGQMGLSEPYISVEVKTEQKGQGGILQIGALTGDRRARYGRLKSDKAVRKVSKDSAEGLVRGTLYFYERKIAQVGQWEARRFRISPAGEQEREGEYLDGQWWLSKPVRVRAENDVARDGLGIFDPLRAERIVADKVADEDVAKLAQYGLAEPWIRVTVAKEAKKKEEETQEEGADTAQMEEYVLLVGKAVEDDEQGQYYARLLGRELIFTVDKLAVEKLDDDLRSRKVFPLANWQVSRVAKVEIARGTELLSLEKRGENWQVVSPRKFWAEQKVVKGLLESVVDLSSTEFAAQASGKEYGLAAPSAAVSVKLKATKPNKAKTYRFWVGNLLEGQGYAVKAEGEDIVRLVPAEQLEKVLASYLAYRKKGMLSLKQQDVQGIEIISGRGKRYRAQREQMHWRMTEPQGTAVDTSKVGAILELMSNLRASKIVADRPEQLKQYGLDQPELRVTLEVVNEDEPKVSYSLLVGSEVKDKADKKDKKSPAHYAMLGGWADIFVLAGGDVQTLKEGFVFEAGD